MKLYKLIGAATLCSSILLQAQIIDVKITNLTHGISFTPLLVATHSTNTSLFTPGSTATTNLKLMAESGDISGLESDLTAVNAVFISNPSNGLLAPSDSTTTSDINAVGNNKFLSIVAMMVPTNDAFIGLRSWEIPIKAGTYRFYVNAYDAGTEANTELLADMPDPAGTITQTGATGVTSTDKNTKVHMHRGVLDGTNPIAGVSDLDSSIHRWLNPVAKITVIVK
ncbi:MAG: hypothetical protein COB17_08030 [Sulfurimonas sp.]|nr:MAG: hypothetical protein COB17_08030 [Sulfurimonas sp.]